MIYEYQSLRHGLIGAWCPSLGDSGRVVRDRIGRNDAALSGGVTFPAWRGSTAMRFDGSTGTATYGNAKITGLRAITVSFWFRRPTTTSVVGIACGTASNNRFFAFTATDGNLLYGLALSSGDFYGWNSLSGLSLNQFHHYAGVYITGTTFAGGFAGYFNGVIRNGAFSSVLGGSGSTASSIPDFGVPLQSGAAFNGDTPIYNGEIDDVRVYGRVLTLGEIRLLATRRGIGLAPRRHRRPLAGSTLNLNVGGTWKATTPWVKVNGVWKKATPKFNVGGIWK